MKILFFSHYFPPESNAPASRTYEHCVRWVQAGHDVTVITGVPNVPNGVVYEGYRNQWWPQVEMVDGIRVVRVWTFVSANRGRLRRTLNYASYLFSALLNFFFRERPDLIIATTPQIFVGWTGCLARIFRRVPLVLEVRDIWPASIVAVGAMKHQRLLRFLVSLEQWMYSTADHIVAVGEGYRQHILERVPAADRTSVITNGVDLTQFVARPSCPEFRSRWGLEGLFVCSYVGTIGMAHGLQVTLRAARLLRDQGRRDIVFLLVGDGAERASLEQAVRAEGLEHWVRFTGRLPKSEMTTVLASSDTLLVHLRKNSLFESVIPSKIFEAMAMERPILMGVRGESARIVEAAHAGVLIEPENELDLVQELTRLVEDSEYYERLTRHGREYVAEYYSRDALAARFLELNERVAAGHGRLELVPPPELTEPELVAEDDLPLRASQRPVSSSR